MNRKERQEAKTGRYRELAEKAMKESKEAYSQSHKLVENIPMGQPVLIGHHSESTHRRILDRSWNTLGKAVKLSEKAEYFEQKAKAAENNASIYLGDDDAVERLEEKLATLGKKQETMKATNKILRSKKLSEIEKHDKLKELGYSENGITQLFIPDCFGEIGFPSYIITNNGSNIRRVKEQLERARKMKMTENKEYTINGVSLVENYSENRLQLFFPSIPDADIRNQLKKNGFKWSRCNECWQSYLNHRNIDSAKKIIPE